MSRSEHDHRRTISLAAEDQSPSGELITAVHRRGTVHVVVHEHAGHMVPGARRDLIDALLGSPEAADSDRLAATIPLGDAESLLELTRRCESVTVRAAGASALLDGRLVGRPVR